MPEASRPVLLFVPGELHIFRATGSYHALELAKDFDLIFLVGEHYRNDAFFEQFLALCPVREVCYIPVRGRIWRRHRHIVRLIRDLTKRWKPAALYQHAFVYPHNLYALFFAAKISPAAKNVVFQAAITAPDLDSLAANLAAGEALRFAQRYRLPMAVAFPLYRLHHRFWCLVSYRILPLLLIGRPLPQPYDMIACRVRVRNRYFPDAYLVYSDFDRSNIEREYGAAVNCRIVGNPNAQMGPVLDAAIYHATAQTNRIVILPSQDWVNEELAAAPDRREAIIGRHANIWIEAVGRLKNRFPGHDLAWKPHPAHRTDKTMMEIVARVAAAFPEMKVVDSGQSAEQLMLESRVVVSDVSNVLWWASLHPGLLVVSLDLWNGKGGDALKGRPSIHYVNLLDQIVTLPSGGSGQEVVVLPSPPDVVRAVLAG